MLAHFYLCTKPFTDASAYFNGCVKVYRHPFQQTFQLDFTISLGDGQGEEMSEPISLAEVNGRTSFKLRGNNNHHDCMCRYMRKINCSGLENGYVSSENKDWNKIEFEVYSHTCTITTWQGLKSFFL